MAKKRVSEAVWEAISPLLPEHKPSPKGGRPPVSDCACLEGIIFVLKTGMPWQMLPTRLGTAAAAPAGAASATGRDWGSGPSCTGGCCACSAGGAGSTLNVR